MNISKEVNARIPFDSNLGILVSSFRFHVLNAFDMMVLDLNKQQTTKIDYLLYVGADTGNEPVYSFLKSKRSD